MNKSLRRLLAILVAGLGLTLALVGPVLVFVQPAATLADIVVFVGNEVVDLAWDPVSCERYEVTRNGILAECVPESGVVTDTETIFAPHTASFTSPTVESAQVETFTGPDFVDFWWDPANIPGCDTITLWRKASNEGSYTAVATPACGAGLVTDTSPSTGIYYSYQFVVQNDAEPPVTIYLDYKSATPGEIGGYLHRNLSLGGTLTITGISVGDGALLTLNGASSTGYSSISDAIFNWDDSVREQGTVIVTGGTFDGASFNLKNAASTITGGQLTNVSVSTRADVREATFDSASIGFAGAGSVALSGNTIGGSSVAVDDTIDVDIGANTFTTSTLSIAGSAGAAVYDNSFVESAVRIREQAVAALDANTFSGHVPDTTAFIDVTSDAGVTIDGNTFHIDNTSGIRPAISIQPDTMPTGGSAYAVSNNVLIGSDAGIGIQVLTDYSADISDIAITDNTVARFERAIDLNNTIHPGGSIAAMVNGNTLTGNVYGILADVHGTASLVTAHNNCIAGNTTAGIYCSNVDNVIDATGNYWGHRTGPRHSANPDGLGDYIWGSATEIDFDPWLESHACYISGLEIAEIEVIQTVQTLSNTIPLVAEKLTIVRVYPDMDAGFAAVDGTLTGSRDGATLGTIQAAASIQAGSITDWDAARADIDTSLVFDLPQDWLHGVVTLRAEATTAVMTGTAVMTTTVSFHERRPIKIAYIPAPVNAWTEDHPITPEDILEVHRNLMARYPFGEVAYRIMPAVGHYADPNNVEVDQAEVWVYSVIAGMTRRWEIINNPDNVADYYITVYGTDITEFTGSWWYSKEPNDIFGRAACGMRYAGHDCAVSLGTLMGLRPLIISPNAAPPPYNYVFPYEDNLTHEFGYDIVNGEIQTPDLYDLMAQEAMVSPLSWISDFHYEKVYLNLAPTAQVVASTVTTSDYLYINGLAGPSDGRFYPVALLENSPQPDDVTPVDPAGEYCLRARNISTQLLESTCFNLDLTNISTGAEDKWTAFTAALTPNPDIYEILLLYNGGLIARLTVPSNPPDVTLVSAHYDSVYQTAQIAWLTTPLDAHAALRYHFHYSADNGATWIPIGVNIHPDKVNYFDGAFHWGVQAAQITPGTQAKLRLIASDGFNETTVTSAAFTVPDVGPWLGIVSPANNAVIDAFPIVLDGYAYDVENGDRSEALTWTSNLDGLLGSGDNLSVAALSGGSHTLTLTADDGDGNIGTDTIHLTVSVPVVYTDYIYLPLVLRNLP